MVQERLDAAGADPRNQGEVQRFAISEARRILESAGVFDPGPVAPNVPLLPVETLPLHFIEAEIERQAKRYQELEFHKRLRMSAGRFKDRVMGLVVPQPEAFAGRFDTPAVVIGTKIPWADQYKMVGINSYLEGLRVEDWEGQDYKTPGVPHLVWMQDGTANLGKSVDDVRKGFALDERGANVYDGVGLYVARPDVLADHYVDLPGTQVGSGGAPGLSLWYGGPGLDHYFTDDGFPYWGSASCGRT